MYKTDPQRIAAAKWHKLLNNGYKFALLDAKNKIIAAARYQYEIDALKRKQPLLIQVTILDQIQ